MTTTTITLTDQEREATTWSPIRDLSDLADSLKAECELFCNAPTGREYVRAADVAGIAQSIASVSAPFAALAEPDEPKEA